VPGHGQELLARVQHAEQVADRDGGEHPGAVHPAGVGVRDRPRGPVVVQLCRGGPVLGQRQDPGEADQRGRVVALDLQHAALRPPRPDQGDQVAGELAGLATPRWAASSARG
jgi:hypothetical protein